MTLRFINSLRRSVFALVLLAAIVYAATPSISDDFTERRIAAGAKVFRALLAADIDIDRKADAGGKLRLGLLYIDDTGNAELAAATLVNRDDPRIRKMKVRIDMFSFTECITDDKGRLAGIFLTQRVTAEQLKTLSAFADARHLVVFSPFEGDVERGVHSGIAVEARVRPYLNTKAMRTARIRLKSFFLKVAKTYEE